MNINQPLQEPTMNPSIDITPELLRTVADGMESLGYLRTADYIRSDADDIIREYGDEQRIDELARIFYEAKIAEFHDTEAYPKYRDRQAVFRKGTIAGVRAILAKLDEEKTTGEPETTPARDIPRMWDQLDDIPGDVRVVRNSFGHPLRREYIDGPWTVRYSNGAGPARAAHRFGPYTEILGGAL